MLKSIGNLILIAVLVSPPFVLMEAVGPGFFTGDGVSRFLAFLSVYVSLVGLRVFFPRKSAQAGDAS